MQTLLFSQRGAFISIGISFFKGKKIVFRITDTKIRH